MMQYKNTITCNMCGNKWDDQKTILQKDFLVIQKDWGYFSKKDGIHHEIIICEECYDKWIATLKISPEVSDITEFL